MAARYLLTKAYIWANMIIIGTMVILGAVFAAGLLANNRPLVDLVEPPASILASILLNLILLLLFFRIVAGFVRGWILSRRAVSSELKERLQKLGVETLTKMKIDRRVGLSVAKKSSEAFGTKNHIYVGERLLQTAPDDEIVGIIAHEMGHLLKKHGVIIRASTLCLRATLFLFALYEAAQSDTGLILGVTALVAFTLARIPLNWKLEFAADAEAAKRLGADPIVLSLEKLKTTNYDGVSFTHPPLSRRIRRIQLLSIPPLTSPISV